MRVRRRRTRPRAHHTEGLAGLAFGEGDQREHPVAQGDLKVVALAHGDHQRVHRDRRDRIAIGVRHGQLVPAQRDPEGGVTAGVDDPDPGLLPGFGCERRGRGRRPAIEQVVGVGHVTGVPTQHR